MQVSIEQLEAFAAAAEQGSFSAAGRSLGKAQSAISTQVANLEIDLGVELFDRSGRSPVLTEAGARLLPEEIARVVRARAASPRWLGGMMRHGFRGAAEIAATLEHMAAFARMAQATPAHLFTLYHEATLGSPALQAFLAEANPGALAAMEAGDLDVTVFQNATGQASSALDAAVALARGEKVEKEVMVPFELVSPQTMAAYAGRN